MSMASSPKVHVTEVHYGSFITSVFLSGCNTTITTTLPHQNHFFFFFFLNDPAPPEISPLPLHAALPIFHDRGRVRGDHRASEKGTDRRRARRLERFVPAQPCLGIVASDLHAFPRGYSADRRLHGQVFHLSVADRNEASRPRRLRRALYRSCALLLLPHRRARLAQGARRSAASGDDQRASRSPRRRRVCFARRRVVS